jgi:hypothetical protein
VRASPFNRYTSFVVLRTAHLAVATARARGRPLFQRTVLCPNTKLTRVNFSIAWWIVGSASSSNAFNRNRIHTTSTGSTTTTTITTDTRYVTTNPTVVRNVVAVSACGCLDNSQIVDQVQISGHRDTAYNGIYYWDANSLTNFNALNGRKRIYRKPHDIYRSMCVRLLKLCCKGYKGCKGCKGCKGFPCRHFATEFEGRLA